MRGRLQANLRRVKKIERSKIEMEFKARFIGIDNYCAEHPIVKFEMLDASNKNVFQNFDTLLEKDIIVKAEKERQKRSLDANAYMWHLLSKLQELLNIPAKDLYKEYIRNCGVYEVVPVRNDALERFINSWQGDHLGNICETFNSKLPGYTNVMVYFGSSNYNNAEMTRLIDYVVADCREYGIETKKENEIKKLLEEWK